MDAIKMTLTYEQIDLLLQAITIAQPRILEIVKETGDDDPSRVESAIDMLQEKLRQAQEVECTLARLDELQKALLEP
ncbi:MAG: hypothetical protein GWN58_24800 [Anaerolineae bacterium]|nr:hypothetical protein [Anaerolineae bacterium]